MTYLLSLSRISVQILSRANAKKKEEEEKKKKKQKKKKKKKRH